MSNSVPSLKDFLQELKYSKFEGRFKRQDFLTITKTANKEDCHERH